MIYPDVSVNGSSFKLYKNAIKGMNILFAFDIFKNKK